MQLPSLYNRQCSFVGVTRSCNFHILALRHIRRSLTRDVVNIVGYSIANTRMDYYNSLLYGVAETHLWQRHICGRTAAVAETHVNKLRRIQNKLVRVICDVGNREHQTIDLLLNLHWLPVRSQFEFKVATLCFKSLHQVTFVTSFIHTLDLTRSARQIRNPGVNEVQNEDTCQKIFVFWYRSLELVAIVTTQCRQ